MLYVQHALPDAGEVTEVENVVELGGCRQHLGFGVLPQQPGAGDQPGSRATHLLHEAPLRTEVAAANDPKDLVNGGIGGQGAVEDSELPLEAGRDVIAASARMNHGCQKLDIHDVGEVPRLLQVVEATHLHQLSHNLIGHLGREVEQEALRWGGLVPAWVPSGHTDLVPPLIDDWHVDVIHKHGHPLASWRTICAAHTLVHVALNGTLRKEQEPGWNGCHLYVGLRICMQLGTRLGNIMGARWQLLSACVHDRVAIPGTAEVWRLRRN